MRALIAAFLVLASAARAQTQAVVRPEIGKPLQAAVAAIKARQPATALARARDAQAVPDKTPYESYLVLRVLGQAAAASGERMQAASALEQAALSSGAPAGERSALLAAAAGHYYAVKKYDKAAALAGRYRAEGGSDRRVRALELQALYLGADYRAAARELAADVRADETAGRKPAEAELQMLANAREHEGDARGYEEALEKLLAHYPRRDYWMRALQEVAKRPDYDERLTLHLLRLRLDVDAMRGEADYVDYAQRALLDGLTAEAARVVERGYAAGVLGKGPQASRHARLKALVESNLGQNSAAPRPGEALEALRAVKGSGAAAAIVRLWVVHLGRQ